MLSGDLPEALVREARAYGSPGDEWVASLPGVLRRLARSWGFSLGEPFSGAHVSFAAPVTLASGMPAVCKVPMADVVLATAAGGARDAEPVALRLWDGDGAVRLLEFDPPSGAMLLERCTPGHALGDRDDLNSRDEIGAELLHRLWRPSESVMGFVRLADIGERMIASSIDRYEAFAEPFDLELFESALDAWQAVRAEPDGCVVLHGDFHHANILAATREPWLAIDPLPMIGDPAYDAVQFLLFCKGDTEDPASEWSAAIGRFCDRVNVAASRVLAWTLVRLVSDALAQISQGTEVEHLEAFQQELWSARLVQHLLN